MKLPSKASRRRAVRYSIILTPLSLLLVVFLLSNQAAPIVYAQPTGWVELVGERTKTGKSFFDPSKPGSRLLEISVAKIHYDGPNWKDIGNALIPSLANIPTLGLVDLEMTTDDYEFYALQTLNTIPLWFYRNKTVPDTYITFNPQALHWTNDLNQIDQISMPQSVIGTVTDNRLHWENAYGPGINLTLSAQAGRLAKALTLESIPPAPAQYILDGVNPALELGFIFGIPSGPNAPEIWIDGVLWGQSARTETVNAIEFRKDGKTLFSFAEPTAYDSGLGIVNPFFILTKQGPNLRVAIRVSLAFLESAVYPIVIDPTVIEQVGASADDGYSGSDTSFDNVGGALPVGMISFTYDSFMRFTTVNIEQGSIVTSANMTVVGDATDTDGVGTLTNIYMDDSDDATTPTSRATHVAKSRTTAFVAWDDVDLTATVAQDSPNFAGAVEEVLARGGWSANNAMMILWDNDGSTDGMLTRAESYDGVPANAVILNIVYSPAWVNTAPTITNKISTETVTNGTSYNHSFSASDPDTNQTLQWELNATDTPFTITVWNEGNRTTYVTAELDTPGTYFVNVTVGDDALGPSGNETDYVNYTLIVRESALVEAETLLENALFFLVGFIPFLMAIGIGFWKEQGSMLLIGGIIGVLLGLWVMVSIYWVFGFSFVGISILFMYIGWVNRNYMG